MQERQGKMTGRTREPTASSPPRSNMEESLQMKSKQTDRAEVDSPSPQITYAPIPNEQNFFRKWSSSPKATMTSLSRPWMGVGLLLTACAVLLQAAVILRRSHARPSVQPDREPGVTDQLVRPDGSVEDCL